MLRTASWEGPTVLCLFMGLFHIAFRTVRLPCPGTTPATKHAVQGYFGFGFVLFRHALSNFQQGMDSLSADNHYFFDRKEPYC